jgi:hypothetical protein
LRLHWDDFDNNLIKEMVDMVEILTADTGTEGQVFFK